MIGAGHARLRRYRRGTAAIAAVVALTAAACGGGDETDAADAGTVEGSTSATTARVITPEPGAGALRVEFSGTELVATAPSGVTCSAAGDRVVRVRAVLDGADAGIASAKAEFLTPAGQVVTVDLAPDAEGVPEAGIGPFPARRDMDDQELQIVVRALLADGSSVDDTEVLVVRGPDGCVRTNGERVRYRRSGAEAASPGSEAGGSSVPGSSTQPGAVTLDVTTLPAPMDVWASGAGACPSGPTTVRVTVKVSAEVERVGGRLLVGGSNEAPTAFVRVADGTWTGTLGPVQGRPAMVARTPLVMEVTAAAGGRSVSSTVEGTLARPEACTSATSSADTTSAPATTPGGSTTPPSAGRGQPPTTVAGQGEEAPAVTLSVATSPAPLAVWATRSGACPSGPTTTEVTARVSSPVERVGARFVVNGSTVAQFALSQQADGSWVGTSPTIEARSGTGARTPLRLEVDASAGARSVSSAVDGTLVEPDRCATTTDASTATPTPAPTTAAPAPGTNAPAPPAPPTVNVSTTGSIHAVIPGACPSGPTTLGVGVQVDATIASITGTVTNAFGQSLPLTFAPAGGNRYSASVGPFNGGPQMPASSPLEVQVTVTDAQGRSASGSAATTLLRPERCAS